MRATWLCVPLACVSGCAWMGLAEPLACNPPKCVQVVVNDCDSSTGTVPTTDPLNFDDRGVKKKIKWVIVTRGYEFTRDGITVDQGGTEFENPELDGKNFTLDNKHMKSGSYKYNIKVRYTGGTPRDCKPRDPTINNR